MFTSTTICTVEFSSAVIHPFYYLVLYFVRVEQRLGGCQRQLLLLMAASGWEQATLMFAASWAPVALGPAAMDLSQTSSVLLTHTQERNADLVRFLVKC